MKRWIIVLIFILFAISWIPRMEAQGKFPNPGDLYDTGIDQFYRGDYETAIATFTGLIRTFPTSTLVSYSYHMIGQCYLKMGRYEEAIERFEFYQKTYPDGDRVKSSEQGIGFSRERLRERARLSTPVKEEKKVKRRICAQVFFFEGKSLDQVEKRMKGLKDSGVDTVILRVFQNKGDRMYRFANPRHEEGVYFKTDYAPVVDDLLGKMAEMAHRNGLEIFAWMTTRYANYGSEGRPEWRGKSYNFETKKLETARGYNLFHPEVIKRLEGLFRDLGRYPIDGILFQDDLILKHNEDFSTEASKEFFKESGTSPHPDLFYIDPYPSESGKYYVKAYSDRFFVWAGWKNRWLMDVARRLMAAARESNPGLDFGINLYYEAVLNGSNSVAWFSQTLEEARKTGFDYYAIMAYHRQTMNELKMEGSKAIDLMAEVAQKAVKSIGNPSQVMMKVQVLDWKRHETIPAKEVETLLDRILNQGKVSLAFVPYIETFPAGPMKGKWMAK